MELKGRQMILSDFLHTKYLLKFGGLALLVGGMFAQPYRVVVVQGNSMVPTYSDKSIHLARRTQSDLYRGEVIVVQSPVGTLVKRVAYLPGDTIDQVKMGSTWVDAVNLYVKPRRSAHLQVRTYTVLPGQVYVLGDNRSRSVDSSTFGTIDINDVWGPLVDQKPYDPMPYDSNRWM
jgi:signal peptidase I